MTYKDDLISFWEMSGDAKSVQKQITKSLIGKELFFEQLSNADARKLKLTIAETGSYQAAKNNALYEEQPPDAGAVEALSHVLDEESGKVIEISDDMRRIAHSIQQRIEGATIITAFLIQLVRDEKLYLAFGCGRFQEYAETMLPFSRQQAYKYISISEKFAPLLPFNIDSKNVASMRQIEEKIASDDSIRELTNLGMSKLYELTKITDADFKEVLSRNVITLDNGEEVDLQDIKDESIRRTVERVKEIKKDYQQRISRLEQDKKKYREERDHFRKQLDKNKERIDRSYEIEAKYGKQASRMKDIDWLLEQTETGLKMIENHFGKVEVEHSDPETLRERVMTLLRRMTLIQEMALRRFDWMHDINELSLFPSWKLKDVGQSVASMRQIAEGVQSTGQIEAVKRIRVDKHRMAIKYASTNKPGSHGWKNLENGFETVEQMEQRYRELLKSDEYEEG